MKGEKSKPTAEMLNRREFLATSMMIGAFSSVVQPIYAEETPNNVESPGLGEVKSLIPQEQGTHFLSSAAAKKPDDAIDVSKFPPPTGRPPYTIELKDVLNLPPQEYKKRFSKGIAFHSVGDTGGENPDSCNPQVVDCMVKRMTENNEIAFFYHLGDVVYEVEGKEYASRYDTQFYRSFKRYKGPVFAIPGSHDTNDYLHAFRDNFCDTKKFKDVVGADPSFKVGVEPNFYWRLRTDFANIIGLSTNAADKGHIDEKQLVWFAETLRYCKEDFETSNKALIVAMYYPPLDSEVETAGGSDGSPWLYQLTSKAYMDSRIFPHLVLSGHWHAYQRLNVSRPTGKQGPQSIEQGVHVVAGCGGRNSLYPITADAGDHDDLFDGTKVMMSKRWTISPENPFSTSPENKYYYGFMEILIDASHITGRFITADNIERDTFVIDIRDRKIIGGA